MNITKKDIIKALRSSRKVYGYLPLNDSDGAYFKLDKSRALKSFLKYDDDYIFTNVTIKDDYVWIN